LRGRPVISQDQGEPGIPVLAVMGGTHMHAALRRMKCAPGKAPDVARLIEAEYIPQLAEVERVIS
jgi:hypothetical protein